MIKSNVIFFLFSHSVYFMQILNKLSLLLNELQTMLWWFQRIHEDVISTNLESTAQEILDDHTDVLRVLNEEVRVTIH